MTKVRRWVRFQQINRDFSLTEYAAAEFAALHAFKRQSELVQLRISPES
ncbi:MAG: hypothetical protein WBQ23_11540 [Bacteroidota bacterium]